MLHIETKSINGFKEAVYGTRLSWNSCKRSDSDFTDISNPKLGPNDLKLLSDLSKLGSDDSKFRRCIGVNVDISGPLYWWKQFDQYKVGTVTLSTSTMHTLMNKELSINDFSTEFLSFDNPIVVRTFNNDAFWYSTFDMFTTYINFLNEIIKRYKETNNNIFWRQIIQMLPSSYMQLRNITLNYEVLANIYRSRKNHKLFEWRELCLWMKTLPYAENIITIEKEK